MADDPRVIQLDALIVGGGVAGLWVANLLHRHHYATALLEADGLGCAQTLGSQGMIHGGLKYALGGRLTNASEAIAGMPSRWRACLAGDGQVNLTGLEPLADRYYLFAASGTLGRLTTFFASRALRARIARVPRDRFPLALEALDGVVYELDDFVIDTPSLVARLGEPIADRIFRHRLLPGELSRSPAGWRCRPAGSDREIQAARLILCAGAGNGDLIAGLGLAEPAMQLRPLKQVVARHTALKPLYAHCLTGITRPEPRLTITAHPDPKHPSGWLWYLGGQLATDGADRSDDEQIAATRLELARCIPWLDWRDAELFCLEWDRAEPAQVGGRRPDEAFVAQHEDVVVCWPTKLSLAPDLGDKVLGTLGPAPSAMAPAAPIDLPPAAVAPLPWATL